MGEGLVPAPPSTRFLKREWMAGRWEAEAAQGGPWPGAVVPSAQGHLPPTWRMKGIWETPAGTAQVQGKPTLWSQSGRTRGRQPPRPGTGRRLSSQPVAPALPSEKPPIRDGLQGGLRKSWTAPLSASPPIITEK